MNHHEKALSRHLFQNKILKADGQAFEDIFTAIMYYAEPDFQQIKPWGNIGDRKNDGYIKSKGCFYQVFAPEDIRKSYPDAVKKIQNDFNGLKAQWSPINEFYFVLNDNYHGVSADCEQAINNLKASYNLASTGILTAKDLENMLFRLSDDQIVSVAGFIPDPATIKTLDFSVLNEVIGHIMRLPHNRDNGGKIILPKWENKIQFNGLSEQVSYLLTNGYIQMNTLDEYLKNNGDFLADALRDRMNDLYIQEKIKSRGDDLFWKIVSMASPRAERACETSVIVIMSKYFETCDIFEEPPEEPSV